MAPAYNFYILVMIRLGKLLSLIFFAFLLSSCKPNKQEGLTVVWKNNQAIGVSIPASLLQDASPHSIDKDLQVRLENTSAGAILGGYTTGENNFIFTPLVPFTRGLTYEIKFKNKHIGKVEIPLANASDAPSLFAIYPSQDTLPENLLKIYFQFSRPMREGESQHHIALLNDQNDTLRDVFLNLQPELWNNERTALTLWLDPGRIKRDLIPNQQMGNPLRKGQRYTLMVSANWKDVQGLSLTQAYKHHFIVGPRDSISPDPLQWRILNLPFANTIQPLLISTGESLDFFLLKEAIRILDEKGKPINGKLEISNEETTVTFIPSNRWLTGRYRLQVESRLEDLAGNNLNKVFDRDIRLQQVNDQIVVEKPFEIVAPH